MGSKTLEKVIRHQTSVVDMSRLAKAMESRDLTQSDLARAIGVSRSLVSKLFKNERTMTTRIMNEILDNTDIQLSEIIKLELLEE